MQKKPCVLIHYTHKGTLGHSTRVHALCHGLSREGFRVHLLQAGTEQPSLHFPENVTLHPIPYPFDSRLSFHGGRTATSLPLRSEFVMQTVRKVNPDIFITEFFPFGRADYSPELLPALRHLRQRGKKICASIGYPFLVQIYNLARSADMDLTMLLIGLYDQLLIHTPLQLENSYLRTVLAKPELQTGYDRFFERIRDKTIYTGYVLPAEDPCPPQVLDRTTPEPYHIVVSRGGGAVYPNIIACAIRAHKYLGEKYRLTIACGPSTTPEEKKLFEACLSLSDRSRIRLFDHIPGLTELMRSCQLSISMCGYNTSVQLLKSGTRSIIIPYINKTQNEPANDQQSRALLLKEYVKSSVVSYHELEPSALAEEIRRKCEHPEKFPPPPPEWFTGTENTIKILDCQLPG